MGLAVTSTSEHKLNMTAVDLFDVAEEFVQAHKHSSGTSDNPRPFIAATTVPI